MPVGVKALALGAWAFGIPTLEACSVTVLGPVTPILGDWPIFWNYHPRPIGPLAILLSPREAVEPLTGKYTFAQASERGMQDPIYGVHGASTIAAALAQKGQLHRDANLSKQFG